VKIKINVKNYFKYNIKIKNIYINYRINFFLKKNFIYLTKKKIKILIENNFILINKNYIKYKYRIKKKDILEIKIPKLILNNNTRNQKNNVLFSDKDILMVNKLTGVPIHPDNNYSALTLSNFLSFEFKKLPIIKNYEYRSGVVHRIDKNTSGLLIITKNKKSTINLLKKFKKYFINKTYYAIIWNSAIKKEGKISINIKKYKKNFTYYKVIKNFKYTSLLECILKTGKTHQIRTHLKYTGNTVFNDKRYYGNKIINIINLKRYKFYIKNCFNIISRQALHAKNLNFFHPINKKYMSFNSEIPEDFKKIIKKLNKFIKIK